MMTTYPHLLGKIQALVSSSKEERIHFLHEDRWIGYDRAKKIIAVLEDLLQQPRKIRPLSLLLVGEPNNGKTTIIREFYRQNHTMSTRDPVTDLIDVTKPAILIEAPPTADEKALYIALLDHFFVPFRPTDSKTKLRYQLIHLLRKFGTRMLIIDEIHNFLSGTAMKQREVMNALKSITNELMISIVGIGTKDAVRVLHTDPQHASRFDVADLPNWDLDLDFRNLLVSYERILPLKMASNLSARQSATLLHEISGGNLGDLNRILVECAKDAILSGAEQISIETIKKFKSLKPTAGLRKVN